MSLPTKVFVVRASDGTLKLVKPQTGQQSAVNGSHIFVKPSSNVEIRSAATAAISVDEGVTHAAESNKIPQSASLIMPGTSADVKPPTSSQSSDVDGKDNFEAKGKADWTYRATGALIAAMETSVESLGSDRSKKNVKFWKTIAADLNSTSALTFIATPEQCRWKWNKLMGTYKDQKDHNDKSGNDPYEATHKDALPHEYFMRIAELRRDNIREPLTVHLRSTFGAKQPVETQPQENLSLDCPNVEQSSASSEPAQQTKIHSAKNRPKWRKVHGSGSSIATNKLALEEKFQKNLDMSNSLLDKKHLALQELLALKKEKLELQKQKLEFKKLKMKTKLQNFDRLLNLKKQIHNETIAEEKRRNDLLERHLLQQTSSQLCSSFID